MAKLTLLIVTFAVLLLVTNASIYRTIIEINDEKQQSCDEQIKEQQQLDDCQQYLKQRWQESGRSRGRSNQQRYLNECCKQLKELDSQCRCQGLEEAVHQQEKEQGLTGEEVEEMFKMALNLAPLCRMPPMHCNRRSIW